MLSYLDCNLGLQLCKKCCSKYRASRVKWLCVWEIKWLSNTQGHPYLIHISPTLSLWTLQTCHVVRFRIPSATMKQFLRYWHDGGWPVYIRKTIGFYSDTWTKHSIAVWKAGYTMWCRIVGGDIYCAFSPDFVIVRAHVSETVFVFPPGTSDGVPYLNYDKARR